MIDLKDALDSLYELNELRDRAKTLREAGRKALTEIKDVEPGSGVTSHVGSHNEHEEWISSGNSVEIALLVKVQNHKDLSSDDSTNNSAEAAQDLKNKLRALSLGGNLFAPRQPDDVVGDRRIPVLVAARAMQALVSRSETVLSKSTLLCYYRIVRELYTAAPPDWTVGAARANKGGTAAFVTGECIRAIFAFGDAMNRTGNFFRQTRRLAGRYDLLSSLKAVLEPNASRRARTGGAQANRPIDEWADKSIERMWFDWFISSSRREGDIALHAGKDTNELFFSSEKPPDLAAVKAYLDSLKKHLTAAVKKSKREVESAAKAIRKYRAEEEKFLLNSDASPPVSERQHREYYRAESAHKFALSLVEKASQEADECEQIITGDRNKALDELALRFTRIGNDIHHVLEPARRYVRTVIHREVAASASGRFDAGELVFAAASHGAMTKWKPSELLTRACSLLVNVLPENGRLTTTRPFHSTPRGHRMLPIGCEMTRSLAQLLQKTTEYEIEPKTIRRMLNIFEEKMIPLEAERVAWNFDGSPEPAKPCVWVTAVSVLALDRIVRMLNDRINQIIFRYFEVVRPPEPQNELLRNQMPLKRDLNLNDLIYPDHDLSKHKNQPSMALRLEQMRAHLGRVTPPAAYQNEPGMKESVYSAIFYGPPGTGKTTLVEALALSSQVPLIRLSPSDLVVQGPAAIEARARFVFEALSMLSQVVIILDEFEDVVGKRVEKGKEHEEKIFQFLRMGMLPKLVKLNKAAKSQGIVYCLATNYFENIDVAAKRRGRFDFHIPVFDPDPISRAGLLLYRLHRLFNLIESDKVYKTFAKPQNRAARFLEVVKRTRHIHASSLAEDYLRLPEWVLEGKAPPLGYQKELPLFWYVLTGEKVGYEKKMNAMNTEQKNIESAADKFRQNLSGDERRESGWVEDYEWLTRYERQISDYRKADMSVADLWDAFSWPKSEEVSHGDKNALAQAQMECAILCASS